MSDVRENQWYHSPTSKRLFIVKSLFGSGFGTEYKTTQVVLVEAFKEAEITHNFNDFEKLLLNNQLQKIS